MAYDSFSTNMGFYFYLNSIHWQIVTYDARRRLPVLVNVCSPFVIHRSHAVRSRGPLLGYHLIVVEWFACPNDPRSSVVWGYMPLVGPPMANRS
ncbi:hypothetical protein D4764_01G0004210 [Takifugu flavidus]|uniref:Uncharacterized protein n=1 Tax=Takifugu flavidus TaxID=433684 RepID=A0A5C6PP23_9TELE|nr:hypothetical protein D4764_01G0004210 [Takifugu flavidus]